jgi:thioredoxin reductase (NADPH)
MTNTQAESLLHKGHLASAEDTVLNGAAWAGTGVLFHTGGTIVNKLRPLGIGSPKPGEVYVLGSRYSDDCFNTRDFLSKNHIGFRFYDPESNFFARRVMRMSSAEPNQTLLLLPDGRRLICPSSVDLAENLGMHTVPSEKAYDTIIVGAGPAGLQSAIYGSSEGLKTLMIDGRGPGGQAGTTSRVENFMGFENGVSGPDLTAKGFQQARRLGSEFVLNEVRGLSKNADGSIAVELRDGTTVNGRSVVLANGVQFREIPGVPNLSAFRNRGVYYGAALTEAPLIKPGENIYVVGGANSAGQAAVKFSELVGPRGQVVVLTLSPLEKSMSQYLIDQIAARPNIKVETGAQLAEVNGEKALDSVTYTKGDAHFTRPADSMFIFIGSAPKTSWLPREIAVDKNGFVLSGNSVKESGQWNLDRDPFNNETSMPGVFTAGDVHSGTAKRIITAAGEGANSISQIHQWLSSEQAAPPLEARAPIAAPRAAQPNADIAALWPEGDYRTNLYGLAGAWSERRQWVPRLVFGSQFLNAHRDFVQPATTFGITE